MTPSWKRGEARRRLLLVEDDDVDAQLFQRAVKRRGLPIEIQRVCDGLEALELLQRNGAAVDLCVVDLNMPRLDGLGFLRALRTDPQLTALPVFVLTTSAAPNDVESAHRLHVAGYMVKEVGDSSLENCMLLLDAYFDASLLPPRQTS